MGEGMVGDRGGGWHLEMEVLIINCSLGENPVNLYWKLEAMTTVH